MSRFGRSRSCAVRGTDEAKPAHRKPHFFSTGLSGVNFSWSFVMRGTLLSATRSSASSSSRNSWTSSNDSNDSRSVSQSSSLRVSSDVGSTYSSKSSPRSRDRAWKSLWSIGWRKHSKRDKSLERQQEQKDHNTSALLDKLPFTGSGKFLTMNVGVRSNQTVKYLVSRSLVTHPLFQVMLKVSEDEFGKEYAANEGVSIVCDPELFLQVVRSVDGNLDSIRKIESEDEILVRTDDGHEISEQLHTRSS